MSTDELVPVEVACRCPGTPHDEDVVYLRPRLGLAAGIAVQKLIVQAHQTESPTDAADLTGVLAEAYLRAGVVSWTFADADGGSVPVTTDSVKALLLDDFEVGAVVADRADDLYMGPVIAPLLRRASTSLLSTPTNGSTSPHGNGARHRPKRSKRSSTTTTRTAGTAKTSR